MATLTGLNSCEFTVVGTKTGRTKGGDSHQCLTSFVGIDEAGDDEGGERHDSGGDEAIVDDLFELSVGDLDVGVRGGSGAHQLRNHGGGAEDAHEAVVSEGSAEGGLGRGAEKE